MAYLNGSLRVIPLPSLLEMLVQVGASGWVYASQGPRIGQVYVEAGQLTLALCGPLRGGVALEAMALGLADGRFEFFGEAEVPPPEPNIRLDQADVPTFLRYLATLAERQHLPPAPAEGNQSGPGLFPPAPPDRPAETYLAAEQYRSTPGGSPSAPAGPPAELPLLPANRDRSAPRAFQSAQPEWPAESPVSTEESRSTLSGRQSAQAAARAGAVLAGRLARGLPVVEVPVHSAEEPVGMLPPRPFRDPPAAVWPQWHRRPPDIHLLASCGLALSGVALAELVIASGRPELGVLVDVGLLLALVVHASFGPPAARPLSLAVTLVPLVRIVGLTVPRFGLPTSDGYLVASLPLLAAALALAHALGLSRQALGLRRGNLPVQLAIGLLGLPVGAAAYALTHPPPLVEPPLSWQAMWWPAVSLAGTGLVEEVLFRGILQAVAQPRLGWRGLLLVSALGALLQVGSQLVLAAGLVFLVSLVFAWLVARTRSLLGVALAHGLANVGLMLVLPALIKR